MGRGRSKSSGKKSSRQSVALKKALAGVEDKIRSELVEYAAIFDADGNKLLDKTTGQVARVSFNTSEVEKMTDAVVTHNHPSGGTFSRGDLKLMLESNMRELRVAHADGFYSLRRNYDFGDTVPENYSKFAADYTRAANKYKRTVSDKYARETLDFSGASKMWADYRHNWLAENAEKYGWTYTYGGV